MKLDVEVVKALLPTFGYEPTDKDTTSIMIALDRVVRRLEDYLNRKDFPPHVVDEAYRMAVAEFLITKKLSPNQDEENPFRFPDKITQLTEGDTSVSMTMSGKNDEADFLNELQDMRRGDPYILEHYRKVHW